MKVLYIFELNTYFFNETACVSFLLGLGVFYSTRSCPRCAATMNLQLESGVFQCGKKNCRKVLSIRANSFFSQHKLPCSKILFIGYLWLTKASVSATMITTGHSSHTICNFYQYFRQLVSDSVDFVDAVIGGEGIIVEVDETKLGKRKYNRGHRIEGVWVVGGVERTEKRRLFAVPVEDRTSETLMELLRKHVLPGSIIYTDEWKGYSKLAENGEFEHLTVNHSRFFKDPVSGVHTNTIEGTWTGVKQQIRPRNRVQTGMEEHLWEFMWRRKNSEDLWTAFIDALKDVHYE